MDFTNDSVLPSRPQSSRRRYSGTSDVNAVFGFSISENHVSILSSDPVAASQQTTQREEGLVDPRTTRRLRWAMRRAEELTAKTQEADDATVYNSNAQGIDASENSVNPVAIDNSSQFLHSFAASPSDNFVVQSVGHPVHYQLDSGVSGGDTLCCGGFPGTPPGPFSARWNGHGDTKREPEFCKNQLQSASQPHI